MKSTTRDTGVMAGIAQMAESARLLTEQLLQPRRTYLKHKAPKSSYLHMLRRRVAAGRVKLMEMLLALAFADIDDGIPSSLVTQWARSYIAAVEAHEQTRNAAKPVADLNPLSLVQRETRAEAVLNAAQNEFLANPDSVAAIDRVIEESARYDAEQDRLIDNLHARRARLTNTNVALSC